MFCLAVALGAFAQQYNPEGLSAMPEEVRAALLSGKTTGPEVKGLLVIELGAVWCKPCKALSEALENNDMPAYFRGQGVRFYQRDFDKELSGSTKIGLANLWDINSVPTLLFVKDGKEVARLKGFSSKESTATINQIKNLVGRYK